MKKPERRIPNRHTSLVTLVYDLDNKTLIPIPIIEWAEESSGGWVLPAYAASMDTLAACLECDGHAFAIHDTQSGAVYPMHMLYGSQQDDPPGFREWLDNMDLYYPTVDAWKVAADHLTDVLNAKFKGGAA